MTSPRRAARLIHLLFVVQLISMGAMEMSGPFWPIRLKALAGSELEFGFAAVAVYVGPMIGIMLTSAWWGRLGDRTGHKLMMIRALLGLAVTQAALAYAADVWTILGLRLVQGACAGYLAPAQTYGMTIVTSARRARLFAYLQVSTNLGSMAGALSGGWILDHATFFWINIAAALLCAMCALCVAAILPDVRADRVAVNAPAVAPAGEQGALAPQAGRAPPIGGLLVMMGVLLMSRTMTQAPFSLYVDSTFHVDKWLAGFCYALMSLGFVTSASLWARYFETKTTLAALQRIKLIAAGCTVITLAAGATRSIELFAVTYFVWGVLLAATTPVLMTLISHLAAGPRQGHLIGIAHTTTQFSTIAGIAFGGWLSQTIGLPYIYFFVSAAYALAFAVITAIARERLPDTTSPTLPSPR
ncbi:MAG TPA: MFS transporter [Trinickia sp.]|uniref:MFS transporter n=1 Tax=Trinickia sp. TaxID=2571163 RepID=UPI002BDDD56A|nr:MFS transporter [Trinickia sp.]HTI18030.1 MFS transporter [Trinickia sp.]